MKKNDFKKAIHPQRSREEWDELIDRYYEGMTTSQEERQLRAFLFSPQAADPVYDEHRAVLSYLAMKGKYGNANEATKPSQKEYSLRKYAAKRWAAAAAVAALLIAGVNTYTHFVHSKKDIYVAYVYGKKYTSSDVVTEQTLRSIHTVFAEDISIEEELGNVFGSLEDNDNNPD